jgi:hypothetical protein
LQEKVNALIKYEFTVDPKDMQLMAELSNRWHDSEIIAIFAMIAKKEWDIEMGLEKINGPSNERHFDIGPCRVSFEVINSDKVFEISDVVRLRGGSEIPRELIWILRSVKVLDSS